MRSLNFSFLVILQSSYPNANHRWPTIARHIADQALFAGLRALCAAPHDGCVGFPSWPTSDEVNSTGPILRKGSAVHFLFYCFVLSFPNTSFPREIRRENRINSRSRHMSLESNMVVHVSEVQSRVLIRHVVRPLPFDRKSLHCITLSFRINYV